MVEHLRAHDAGGHERDRGWRMYDFFILSRQTDAGPARGSSRPCRWSSGPSRSRAPSPRSCGPWSCKSCRAARPRRFEDMMRRAGPVPHSRHRADAPGDHGRRSRPSPMPARSRFSCSLRRWSNDDQFRPYRFPPLSRVARRLVERARGRCRPSVAGGLAAKASAQGLCARPRDSGLADAARATGRGAAVEGLRRAPTKAAGKPWSASTTLARPVDARAAPN